ncbi:MAG: ABC transporter permease [Gemmatimonadota bacterium]
MPPRRRLRPFTIISAATVAVSVAVLTTAFSLAWAALWRPPPFEDAARLVMLYTTHANGPTARREARWSYPRLTALASSATSFTSVSAYTGTEINLTGSGEAEASRGEFVSPSYFATLGVGPAMGRSFDPGEDVAAEPSPVVVISDELWQRRFGGRRDIVGQPVGINGVTHDIIGVMPRRFHGLTDRAQLWLPTAMASSLTYPEYLTTDQDFISVVARLAPESSADRASIELRTLVPRLYRQYPDADPVTDDAPSGFARSLNAARIYPSAPSALYLLMGAMALLHLLACANVTSLLLGDALTRRAEWAVRAALGGTPRMLFLRHVRETMRPIVLGGAFGTAIAASLTTVIASPTDFWGTRNFYGALAPFATPGFSWEIVGFGLLLTVLSAAAVAWFPARLALAVDVSASLRDAPRGATVRGTSLRRSSARALIVAAEVALAVMLCVAGGLMVESFNRMRQVALGVDVDRVLTFTIRPADARVSTAAAPAYIDRMLAAITALPGVSSATVDGGAPVSGTARSTLFIAGRDDAGSARAPNVLRHYVAPAHFKTLGIPVVRGRSFTTEDDLSHPGVAIISEGAARELWPGDDPIGQRVWFGSGPYDAPAASVEIVGVVGDVMYEPLDAVPNLRSFYTPYAQFTYGWRLYFVRTSGDPGALIAPIRDAVHRIDPDTPVTEVATLRSLVGASWARQRFDAAFYGGFAVLALGLAVCGIYAVVAFAVAQRTHEMGIRLALGARPRAVVALVVRDGLTFPIVGLLAGALGAMALGGILRASLYGVEPTDVCVLGGTLVLMLVAAVAACLVPARRAIRVDPLEAMRCG